VRFLSILENGSAPKFFSGLGGNTLLQSALKSSELDL